MVERSRVVEKLRSVRKKRRSSSGSATKKQAFPSASGIYPERFGDQKADKSSRKATAFDAMLAESRSNRQTITQLIDPGEMFAGKSLSFNKYVMDFIYDTGAYGHSNPYTDQQLLMSYMTSVYMFAALRRVSNLISRIKIVAQIKQGNKYVRAPETAMINRIFERDGPAIYSRMYLNYAIYGGAVAFKTKTMKAVLEENRGTPIYDYRDGAVAGLHVLDKPFWELDEDTYNGEINGLYVQRGTKYTESRNYLDRREFCYFTDWNPENPNRGRSVATVAIHEAVTNAAIARWSAEYFTRGAMPFVLVAMEEDPAMIADTDLLKYKRQFEDQWQGVNSSLRSVFIDRKVDVQQVGIAAGEVAAAELNESALEGIAAAVGLDRELVVTPAGGSQERHAVLVKRAWEDTIIPTATAMMSAFANDLGLADDMRLVLDLDHIQELDADREQKAGTEIQILNDTVQTFNETRSRLDMPTIPDFDGLMKTEDGYATIEQIAKASKLPLRRVQEAYDNWFERGIASFNAYRVANGLSPVKELNDVINVDGKLMRLGTLLRMIDSPRDEDVQREVDMIERGLTFINNSREKLGLPTIDNMDDVVLVDGQQMRVSELLKIVDLPHERRSQVMFDQHERTLRSFNDLRKEFGLDEIEGMNDVFMVDGRPMKLMNLIKRLHYPSEDFMQLQMDVLDQGLISFNKARREIGLPTIDGFDDVIRVDGRPMTVDQLRKNLTLPSERQMDVEMQLFEQGLQDVNTLLANIGREPIPEFSGWYMHDGRLAKIESIIRSDKFLDEKIMERITDLYNEDLLPRSVAAQYLGIELPEGAFDGYRTQVQNMFQMEHDRKIMLMEQELELERERKNQLLEIQMDRLRALSEAKTDREVALMEARWEKEDEAAGKSTGDHDGPDDDGPDGGPGGGQPLPDIPPFRPDGYIKHDLNQVFIKEMPTKDARTAYVLSGGDIVEIRGRTEDDKYLQVYVAGMGVGWIEKGKVVTDRSDNIGVTWTEESPKDMEWLVSDIPITTKARRVKSEDEYMDFHDSRVRDDAVTEMQLRTPQSFGLSEEDVIEIISRVESRINENRLTEAGLTTSTTGEDIETDVESHLPNNSLQVLDPEAAYCSIWIGANPELKDIQDEVKRRMHFNQDIDWVKPESFHVTLLYVKDVKDDGLDSARKLLPSSLNPFEIHVGPLASFDNEFETVIYITVRSDTYLQQLQQKFNVAFSAYGTPMSEYSDPAQYTPHITLGYAPPGTALPEVERYAKVSPEAVYIGRDNYKMVHQIPVVSMDDRLEGHDEPDGTKQVGIDKDAEERLKGYFRSSWKRRVEAWRSNGAPPDNLPNRIVDAIQEKNTYVKSINGPVFKAAIKAIDAGLFDEDVEPSGNPLDNFIGKAKQSSAYEELKAWERKTIRGFKSKNNVEAGLSFENILISKGDGEAIRAKLKEVDSIDEIKTIFGEVKDSIDE